MKKVMENVLKIPQMPSGRVITWLPMLFLFVNLFRMISGQTLPYLGGMMLAGAAGGVLLLCRQVVSRDRLPVLVIAAIFILFGALNMFLIGNVDAGSLLTEVMMFGTAFLILSYPNSMRSGENLWYAFLAIYSAYWMLGIDPSEIMHSSNNYVSVILLIAVFFYYTALEREGEKIDSFRKLLPALMGVVMAGWGRGRAGILTFGFLMAGMVALFLLHSPAVKKIVDWIKKAFASGEWKKILLVVCVGLGVAAVAVIVLKRLGIVKFLLGKFTTRGFDNIRPQLWGDYIRSCVTSADYMLLGAPLEDITILEKFNGNLHNSFLQVHADHGLLVFLLMVCLLVLAVVYYSKKKMYVHLLVLGAFCIRASFDKFVSMQYGMLMLAYFMLYPLFEDPAILKKLISRKKQENL